MTAFHLSDGSSADGDPLGLWRDDPAAVAFDDQRLQVWRADLPADAALARDRLAALQARLRRASARLSQAAAQPELVAPVEFAAPTGWWRDACGELVEFAGRVVRACSPTALIETSVGGAVVGCSVIGLRGDMRTAWRAGRGQEERGLHAATVGLTLSTRATLLRTVALVMRTAPAIAVRLALPYGPLLALPAAWRAVQAVLRESNEQTGEQ